jgi:uncharacterized protein YneF (UPF0154 family)
MKKTTAWILWGICATATIFSLVKMFIGSEQWIIYALVVGVGFYFTRKIFKKHLSH